MKAEVSKNLRTTLAKMEVALGSIKEAIVWVNREGVIQWSNTSFDNFIGKEHIYVLNASFYEIFPLYTVGGNDLPQEEHPIHNVFQSQEDYEETYLFLNDNKMFELNVSASYLNFSEEEQCVILTIQDITKRKQMMAKLGRATMETELMEAKVAIQTEFTSTVSHELRTPLASIKSSIDIINSETPGALTDDQKMFLGRAKSNVDRLNRLINDILDLSKMESGKIDMNFAMTDVSQLVGEVMEGHAPVAKDKSLSLEMQIEAGLPRISLDPDKMIQVLNNLINNAIKFTDAGSIKLSLNHMKDEKVIQFCVSDTGLGITEENQAKLFEKFQQIGEAADQIEGTGLGLAICKEIIKRHGGKIWVESELGEGTSIFFVLPVGEREGS